MTLQQIIFFSLFSLLVGWLAPYRVRFWMLLIASILGVFILQSTLAIRWLDFWLPSLSIGLTLIVWALTRSTEDLDRRSNIVTLGIITIIILVLGITRYFGNACCLTASRPPQIGIVLIIIACTIGIALIFYIRNPSQRVTAALAIILILGLFTIIKSPELAQSASKTLRRTSGQDTSLASQLDIVWLGFSYLAFRLLHVLRDYQSGKLPRFSASEFATYALFFPALPAGPLDRSQRFIQNDLRSQLSLTKEDRLVGAQRLIFGIFKKFVIADSLAIISLNPQNALQVQSTIWMWLLLFAYALRLYFDFSGYTDVALGMGRLVGIRLPENFAQPYLKSNITAFWNSWHITLAQWFRAYFFNPLTRSLRGSPRRFPAWLIILTGQVSTMLLIGLWHGITWNYAIWGLWHGVGLFVHNRWSSISCISSSSIDQHRRLAQGVTFSGWLITFVFICLGWVWFAMPDVQTSMVVFTKLFGW
jgi:D-alanyl-lipoteichoic acid acyltransferase DltB (MBOAT superfamily)